MSLLSSSPWPFLREFLRNTHATGAIFPSGSALSTSLASTLPPHAEPLRILEVGPGTGAVTRAIIPLLRPGDRLDLVEVNSTFVSVLRRRFDSDPAFSSARDCVRIFPVAIEQLPADERYHHIICGLPFNNFPPEQVTGIFLALLQHLSPQGSLSFFEYIGIRHLKALVSGQKERQRLRAVRGVLRTFLSQYETSRKSTWRNIPPAQVHFLTSPSLILPIRQAQGKKR